MQHRNDMATRGKKGKLEGQKQHGGGLLSRKEQSYGGTAGHYVRALTRIRERWKQCVRALCASGHEEDR
jgi:hypothetical protein